MNPLDDDIEIVADDEEQVSTPEEEALGVVEEPPPVDLAIPELAPELEVELKKALAVDELDENSETPKAKTHQVPQKWIDQELRWEDWIDKGSI